MPEDAKRGDHDYVDAHHPGECQPGLPPKSVFDAERAAIKERREHNKNVRDRPACSLTGLALSGGGIRSASFGLGALQALHAKSGIEGIDYLSTVSGGGYIGCALTAAMQESPAKQNTTEIQEAAEAQKTGGKFPFTNPDKYDDTDSVRHIRDFSNYLIPHGALDVVTAMGIIGRGLVANMLILLPVLLFLAWLTLLIHPTVDSLSEPKFLVWNLADGLAWLGLPVSHPLWGLRGYWFTIILAGVNILFLVLWAFVKSISVSYFWQVWFKRSREPGYSAELRNWMADVSKALFFITLTMAWLETQPFILHAMAPASTPDLSPEAAQYASSAVSGARIGKILHGWFGYLIPILAPIGAVFAFLSKYLGDIVALAKRDARWQAWVKKILAIAALWFAAIIVPSFLWLLYLQLTYFGISYPDFPYLPDWLSSFTHATPQAISELPNFVRCLVPKVAALVYLEAFVITGLVALFINPNATSLYRLYRDRLSKAFLFDPDPRRHDKYGDLQAYEPKLHEINTNLCPYPIVNAALNIEGSQYANKRGRNADFFVFTPEYTGSDATGYIGTQRIEKEETALDLGTAMAISAAAVSPDMGSLTIKPLSFTLAFLNVRLGYWLRNPYDFRQSRSLLSRLIDVRSFLLFKEMSGWITEKSSTVYLTDGGHVENLGIYSLMKRRCELIIAIDAEADPVMSFHAFLKLERYARIDLGTIIDLPWQAIRKQTLEIDKAFDVADKADKNGSAIPCSTGPHCAAGEIRYGPHETGILLYVKASLSGDEDDYILDYKRRYRDFPHETTGDQFFGEEQLEVYRALGFHIVSGLLTGETSIAVKPGPNETEGKARLRILSAVRAALLGTGAKC